MIRRMKKSKFEMNGGGRICSFIMSFCQSRYGEENKKRDVNAIDGYSKCELVVAKISKDKVPVE